MTTQREVPNEASLVLTVKKLHEAHNQIDQFIVLVDDQTAKINELEHRLYKETLDHNIELNDFAEAIATVKYLEKQNEKYRSALVEVVSPEISYDVILGIALKALSEDK